jgi:hypothetical protein
MSVFAEEPRPSSAGRLLPWAAGILAVFLIATGLVSYLVPRELSRIDRAGVLVEMLRTRKGMTKEDAVGLLGTPSYEYEQSGCSHFAYILEDRESSEIRMMLVTFSPRGKVEGVDVASTADLPGSWLSLHGRRSRSDSANPSLGWGN